MTETQTRPPAMLATSGRWLIAAFVPVVAFVAVAHLSIEGDSAADMTPDQVADRAVAWVGVAVLWVLPVVVAGLAFLRIVTVLGADRVVRPFVAAGLCALVVHVLVQSGAIWFVDSPTLADSRLYAAAILSSLAGWWAVTVAAAVTCHELFRARIARRPALVIGVLTTLLLVLDLAVYLPALVGSSELHDTIGLPPMLLPLLWAVLGGFLVRRRDQVPG